MLKTNPKNVLRILSGRPYIKSEKHQIFSCGIFQIKCRGQISPNRRNKHKSASEVVG